MANSQEFGLFGGNWIWWIVIIILFCCFCGGGGGLFGYENK